MTANPFTIWNQTEYLGFVSAVNTEGNSLVITFVFLDVSLDRDTHIVMTTRFLANCTVDDLAFHRTMLLDLDAFLKLRNVEPTVFNFCILWDAKTLLVSATLKLGELCFLGEEPIECRVQIS